MRHWKKILVFIAVTSLVSCKKYFDINADPASPQNADLASILPPVLANSVFHLAVEGLNASNLTQNFTGATGNAGQDIHSGNPGGASATSFWRTFYTTQGVNINLILDKGLKEENWDYVGIAYAMRAWGFQQLTDYFGDVPFYDAWQPNKASFRYDPQELVYNGIDSLCRSALFYLSRTDGKVSTSTLSRADFVYKGDRAKWIKFVYGLLARRYNRLTNKSNYVSDGYADSVIKFVGLSFETMADNFQVAYPSTKNDDTNPFGPARSNFNTLKQSRFITQLLDGTIFVSTPANPTAPSIPSNRDPRLRGLLALSADTVSTTASMPVANGGYRFNVLTQTGGGDFESIAAIAPNATFPIGNPAYRRRVSTVYADSLPANTGSALFVKSGRYVFQNTAPGTLMAHHELQFILAEAWLRKGNKQLAQAAYERGVDGHFDFVNFYSNLAGNTLPITIAQRNLYKSTPAFKTSANFNALTLTDIMLQKYIGDWAWNPYESWSDVRRYHYFDLDAETGDQIYKTFMVPFYSTNNLGPKPVYRFLPTFNSEFDWNEQEIRRIGGFNTDYHTYEMWFSQP